MRVGIIDYDLWRSPKSRILNVEVMKLGTYYEGKGCQVDVLSPENNIFHYDKIILVSDNAFIPKGEKASFLRHPNMNFFGEVFNNKNYVSFNNEIDYLEPQNKFYNNLLKYYFKEKIYTMEEITKLKEKTFIRLFPGASAINIEKVMTGRKIYLVDDYIFNKENWEKTMEYLAIFHKYFEFVHPQIIENIEDLKNFKKLVDYGFVGLRGRIRIETIEDFSNFIKEAKDILLNDFSSSRFIWEIAYSKNNNYSEQFYSQEFYNSLLKIKILNDNNIKIMRGAFSDYSNFEFTDAIFNSLKKWMRVEESTKRTFNEYIFEKVKKRKIKDLYLRYLQKHPEYEPLINIIYKKGGE